MTPVVTAATDADLPGLADVAARTFPLACPPSATADNVAAFIAEHLSPARFAAYVADPTRDVLLARDAGRVVGYAMLIDGVVDDPDVQRAVLTRPAAELSKMYVDPDAHGAGAASALMTAALDAARERGATAVWLGVNQENARAQRFYGKHGFTVSGTKTFRLGDGVESDYVMVRPL
ncbi:GNAT family N-acetyltransferase [Mycolicibacterium grossiae]|uniref:GNAT family N-acetyltransferase n=1 Tax=Mycolicibacterium grossiae TaxID=1552759 RepID=A0A1E8QBF5_9MYCO|nr:GNAT family N-acetyltransferase [Mycolicibacterium grossiae]OFJ55374.1 GNAT family N-acetyltransferase [Mycolicibacterium grossiae]